MKCFFFYIDEGREGEMVGKKHKPQHDNLEHSIKYPTI